MTFTWWIDEPRIRGSANPTDDPIFTSRGDDGIAAPDIIAREIVEDFESGLELFTELATDLEAKQTGS